jgi:rhodanese-related sulfurtransferase
LPMSNLSFVLFLSADWSTDAFPVPHLDVREPEELLETGRIPGAINVPITSAIQSFHIADEDFTDMYGFERPSKDTHLMFYCKAGVRAKSAAGLAAHAGWQHVGDYPGSWLDWDAQKGPKEQRQKDGPGWERV